MLTLTVCPHNGSHTFDIRILLEYPCVLLEFSCVLYRKGSLKQKAKTAA